MFSRSCCGLGCLIALAFAAADGATARPAAPPLYVLNGYKFEGALAHQNAAPLVAKLKHHRGDRVREADLKADVDILADELHVLHIRGRLVTGTAERNGHIWVVFDLVEFAPPGANLWTSRHLISQQFQGTAGVSGAALARASGLRPGDTLSAEKIVAARKAILLLLHKAERGKELTLRVRIQTRPKDEVALTWIVGDREQSR